MLTLFDFCHPRTPHWKHWRLYNSLIFLSHSQVGSSRRRRLRLFVLLFTWSGSSHETFKSPSSVWNHRCFDRLFARFPSTWPYPRRRLSRPFSTIGTTPILNFYSRPTARTTEDDWVDDTAADFWFETCVGTSITRDTSCLTPLQSGCASIWCNSRLEILYLNGSVLGRSLVIVSAS